jgi:hypothetical protein
VAQPDHLRPDAGRHEERRQRDPGQFEAKGHDYRADLARFVREVYALPASDDQLAAVERALRTSELERKRLLDAAKAAKAAEAARAGDGQAGGSGSSSSNAASRS